MRKVVLFDLDGTLTDPMLGITSAVSYALASFGIEVRNLEELTPFIGPPLMDSFHKYYGFDEQKAKEAVEKYREYFAPKGIFENEIYPGILEMLEAIEKCGYMVVLATSKPWVYAKQILEYFEIDSFFSCISGSELSGVRNDKTEVVAHAMQLIGADSALTIMVGDRLFDIQAAKTQGIASVGVSYGYGSRQELLEAGADVIADSVEELRNVLIEWRWEK